MKTLLAAAALAITGALTVQAADIFTCSGLGTSCMMAGLSALAQLP
jgi:hypothetical protein